MPDTKKMNNHVRRFLQEIGRKGGIAGKGSPRRIAANRRTAINRQRKEHPLPKKVSA